MLLLISGDDFEVLNHLRMLLFCNQVSPLGDFQERQALLPRGTGDHEEVAAVFRKEAAVGFKSRELIVES